MQQRGGWRFIRQALFTGFTGSTAHRQAGAQQQQQARTRHRPDLHEVVTALRKLPAEAVTTKEDLQHETVQQLRERIMRLGLDCKSCLEKQELIDKVLQAGGSSGSSCSICCEDYVSGDLVRVLPCKHRFHIECVDRWFLSAVDYSRAPACPLCNAELLQ
eukprot:jgi/Chrzof1/12161/Cz06g23110.t1